MTERSDTPFRVYVLDDDGDPVCVGAADDVSLGDLLVSLHERGKIGNGHRAGIMHRPVDDQRGEWLVFPWARRDSLRGG